jgi:ketosteroid isomerase-like protein
MSRENVEVVRQIYESWTRGDFRGGVEAFDPDIEFEMDASVTMSGPVKVRGLAEMGTAWRESLSGWGDFRVGEIIRLVETEDGVIAFNRLQGRGRRSGIVIDQPDRAAIFTFRNGRIVRLRLTTATEALEAAGLSE